MKNILIGILLIISFLLGLYFAYPVRSWAGYMWDSHAIAGGLSGTDGVPIKVAADGTVSIQ